MYAVVETGGKQYRLKKDDIIEVEKIDAVSGKSIKLSKVLLCADGKKVDIGRPHLKNVKVDCEVLGNKKGVKTISFKYKRRKSSRRKIGNRQELTRLKVKGIIVS